MNDYSKTKSGLLVPKKEDVGVKCAFCPMVIFKDKEAKGRLFVKNGKPICVRCRILTGKFGNKIKSDKGKFEKDYKLRNDIAQQRANDEIMRIAAISQKKTKTLIKPR